MNRHQLIETHETLCESARNILQEKVQNYSGDGDVFTNFRRVEHLKICTTSTGILARMADKFGRLITHTHTKGGLVGDESFKDSIIDLINYLVFLYCNVNSNMKEIDDDPNTDSEEESNGKESGLHERDLSPLEREMVSDM
jgi:hypothetical protein